MRVAIIGCGRVGLVTGCGLAYLGHNVVCIDTAGEKIEKLKKGLLPLYEPHLESLIQRARQEGRLTFSGDPSEAIRDADVVFLCMGIRSSDDGDPDLSSLDSVAKLIAAEATSSLLIVQRSTMPVQTGKVLREMLSVYARKKPFSFSVAANPQFFREGTAIHDLFHSDRILLGVDDPQSERTLRDIYRPITERTIECPLHQAACSAAPPAVLVTSVQSAELIKHSSNAYLAMKISYVNMIADLCECLGGDIAEVTCAMGHDPRIGPAFLEAGLGFGGLRLPRDLRAMIELAERLGISPLLFKEVEHINSHRIDVFFQKIREALWIVKSKQIGVLGLSFKPDTDEIGSSPAIALIHRLIAEGANVQAYDPQALANARNSYPHINLGLGPYEITEHAEALVIATPWTEFRQLNWERIRTCMLRPLILDGCNLLSPSEMRRLGFEYYSCGRPLEEYLTS